MLRVWSEGGFSHERQDLRRSGSDDAGLICMTACDTSDSVSSQWKLLC